MTTVIAAGEQDLVPDERTVSVARAAAADEGGGQAAVGELIGAHREDDVALTVWFRATDPGYRGWQWSVTLAALADPAADVPTGELTVSEVVLLPGADALVAPAWVPWERRVRAGDLGVGDLLPPDEDDGRLVPAYLESDDPAVEDVAHELGIGRRRVLGREGRVEAADRWHDGEFGPDAPMATHAPAHCASCAFYLPLAGSLGTLFGACGNEFAPADGRVVDAGYGCGAHSDAAAELRAAVGADHVVDELRLEVHLRPEALGAADLIEEPTDSAD
jgi:hypothetical protein